jgi:hypothetical protein
MKRVEKRGKVQKMVGTRLQLRQKWKLEMVRKQIADRRSVNNIHAQLVRESVTQEVQREYVNRLLRMREILTEAGVGENKEEVTKYLLNMATTPGTQGASTPEGVRSALVWEQKIRVAEGNLDHVWAQDIVLSLAVANIKQKAKDRNPPRGTLTDGMFDQVLQDVNRRRGKLMTCAVVVAALGALRGCELECIRKGDLQLGDGGDYRLVLRKNKGARTYSKKPKIQLRTITMPQVVAAIRYAETTVGHGDIIFPWSKQRISKEVSRACKNCRFENGLVYDGAHVLKHYGNAKHKQWLNDPRSQKVTGLSQRMRLHYSTPIAERQQKVSGDGGSGKKRLAKKSSRAT